MTMAHVAEILVDHPHLTVTDQVNRLYVQKTLNYADYRALLTTIAEERSLLDDPLTAALAIALADGRARMQHRRRYDAPGRVECPRGATAGRGL